MRPRVDLLFRLGFAGKHKLDVPGGATPTVDAGTSPGFDLRVDIPVIRYLTLGPAFSFYVLRADVPLFDRNPVLDISAFMKGRYPFKAGRKKAEVYGLFHVGFSAVFVPDNADSFGPGFNVGLTPGFQILLGRRFGLVTELGWARTQGNLDAGNLIVNQGVWRFGFVF